MGLRTGPRVGLLRCDDPVQNAGLRLLLAESAGMVPETAIWGVSSGSDRVGADGQRDSSCPRRQDPKAVLDKSDAK